MFETSKDILNWVLALSSLAIAFFICWGLYYLITTVRRSLKIVHQAERIIAKAESLMDLVKNKVASSASYLFMVTEFVKKVSKIIKDKKSGHSREDDEEEEDYEYVVRTKNKDKKKNVRVK